MTLSAYDTIWQGMVILGGRHSGIPECCIAEYIDGRRFFHIVDPMGEEERAAFVEKCNYVPCKKCFEEGKYGQCLLNGSPVLASMLGVILDEIRATVEPAEGKCRCGINHEEAKGE